MEVYMGLFLLLPTVIHSEVVVHQQTGPSHRRGIVWTPYNATSLWFLPVTEGVTIIGRYSDGVENTHKKLNKDYNATFAIWTEITYTIFTESSNTKLEVYFKNNISSSTRTKYNIGNPGDLWSVHLTYENGSVIWTEKDPHLYNNVGFVYDPTIDVPRPPLSRYESLPVVGDMSEAECSCMLPIIYWLMGTLLVIVMVVVLVVLVYKCRKKYSGSVTARSNKYQVSVTRSSLNHSGSAASRISGLHNTRQSKHLASDTDSSLRPRLISWPQSNFDAAPQPPQNDRPQSQFVISDKHPVPCTMVVHPPTPPPEDVSLRGSLSSLGSLRPFSATLGDTDDFSSCSARSSADGVSQYSVDNDNNTQL